MQILLDRTFTWSSVEFCSEPFRGCLKQLLSTMRQKKKCINAYEFSYFRKMESIDLVSKATVDDLIFQKFESPLPNSQDEEDPFMRGEFDVIKELLEKFPATVEGKKKIDRVIDVCGPSPKGVIH